MTTAQTTNERARRPRRPGASDPPPPAAPPTAGPRTATNADRWLEQHGDALWRYAVSRLGAEGDAEDAVQDTLLAALHAAGEFRGESTERTWLIGILRHKISDIRRRQGRTTNFDPYDVFNARGRWSNKPSRWPASARDADGLASEVLEGCLDRLPPVLAEAFLLRETRGFSTASIASEQGASENSVRVRLHRAREALRRCLTAQWAGPISKGDPR